MCYRLPHNLTRTLRFLVCFSTDRCLAQYLGSLGVKKSCFPLKTMPETFVSSLSATAAQDWRSREKNAKQAKKQPKNNRKINARSEWTNRSSIAETTQRNFKKVIWRSAADKPKKLWKSHFESHSIRKSAVSFSFAHILPLGSVPQYHTHCFCLVDPCPSHLRRVI